MTTQLPNVTEVRYRDLSQDTTKPIPGDFCLEVHFSSRRTLPPPGLIASLKNLFSGLQETYVSETPPMITFQIRDYSHPAVQDTLDGMTDRDTLNVLMPKIKAQMQFRSDLGAPSVPAACAAQLFGELVAAKEMDAKVASESLAKQFGLGQKAANGLIQRGLEKARESQLGG